MPWQLSRHSVEHTGKPPILYTVGMESALRKRGFLSLALPTVLGTHLHAASVTSVVCSSCPVPFTRPKDLGITSLEPVDGCSVGTTEAAKMCLATDHSLLQLPPRPVSLFREEETGAWSLQNKNLRQDSISRCIRPTHSQQRELPASTDLNLSWQDHGVVITSRPQEAGEQQSQSKGVFHSTSSWEEDVRFLVPSLVFKTPLKRRFLCEVLSTSPGGISQSSVIHFAYYSGCLEA